MAPVHMEANDSMLLEMMTQLMARLDKLEEKSSRQMTSKKGGQEPLIDRETTKQRVVTCYRCRREGHFAKGCAQPKKPLYLGNELPLGRPP